MIHPQLAGAPHATMLVYLFTDAAADPALLAAAPQRRRRDQLQPHLHRRRHLHQRHRAAARQRRIRRDAQRRNSHLPSPPRSADVCTSLAKQIVADAEGATHLVELNIRGAASDADALRIAKAIAHSPLVKTAWAGNDPNWGRLIAATGYSGARSIPRASPSVSANSPSASAAAAPLPSTKPPRIATSASPSSPSTSTSDSAAAPAVSGPATSPASTSPSTPTTPLETPASTTIGRTSRATICFVRRHATKVVHGVQPSINTA